MNTGPNSVFVQIEKEIKSRIPGKLEQAFGNKLRYKVAWATFLLLLVREGYREITGSEGSLKEGLAYPSVKNKVSRACGFLLFQNYMLLMGTAVCSGQ